MVKDRLNIVDEYLKMTGQSRHDIFCGANQVGLAYILKELVPKALGEKKKIVWVVEDEDLATGDTFYRTFDQPV